MQRHSPPFSQLVLEFDPTDKYVVDDAHRRKKAATLGKVRTKRLKVVMLSDIQPSIPKGSRRQSLGQILEVAFRRCMMSNEVMEHVRDAFKDLGNVSNFQFLRAHQDNTLQVAEDQQLDGLGVIKLAGCGSLYVKQSDDDIAVTTNDEPKDKVSCDQPSSNTSITSKPSSSITSKPSSSITSKPSSSMSLETSEFLDKAKEILQKLQL